MKRTDQQTSLMGRIGNRTDIMPRGRRERRQDRRTHPRELRILSLAGAAAKETGGHKEGVGWQREARNCHGLPGTELKVTSTRGLLLGNFPSGDDLANAL